MPTTGDKLHSYTFKLIISVLFINVMAQWPYKKKDFSQKGSDLWSLCSNSRLHFSLAEYIFICKLSSAQENKIEP